MERNGNKKCTNCHKNLPHWELNICILKTMKTTEATFSTHFLLLFANRNGVGPKVCVPFSRVFVPFQWSDGVVILMFAEFICPSWIRRTTQDTHTLLISPRYSLPVISLAVCHFLYSQRKLEVVPVFYSSCCALQLYSLVLEEQHCTAHLAIQNPQYVLSSQLIWISIVPKYSRV